MVIFAVVWFSWISQVGPRKHLHFNLCLFIVLKTSENRKFKLSRISPLSPKSWKYLREIYGVYNTSKCDGIARGQFSKITETARLSGLEFGADKSSYGVYVTRYWNWINSYWMFWIGCLRGARSVSSFCDFRKITFRDFTGLFSFLTQENLLFFRYSYEGVLKLLVCPNINFDSVDFSERRPEEVTFLLTLSVCTRHKSILKWGFCRQVLFNTHIHQHQGCPHFIGLLPNQRQKPRIFLLYPWGPIEGIILCIIWARVPW